MLPTVPTVPPPLFSTSMPLPCELPRSQLFRTFTFEPGMMRMPLPVVLLVDTAPLIELWVVELVWIQMPAVPLPLAMTVLDDGGVPPNVPISVRTPWLMTRMPCAVLLSKSVGWLAEPTTVALDAPVMSRPSPPLPRHCTPAPVESALAAVPALATSTSAVAKFWIVTAPSEAPMVWTRTPKEAVFD